MTTRTTTFIKKTYICNQTSNTHLISIPMNRFHFFVLFVALTGFLSSCSKESEPETPDYRDQWVGEYHYVSDRDDGMEGVISDRMPSIAMTKPPCRGEEDYKQRY